VCVCVCVFLGAVAGGRGMQIAKLSARPHFVLNNLCGNVCHTHTNTHSNVMLPFMNLILKCHLIDIF